MGQPYLYLDPDSRKALLAEKCLSGDELTADDREEIAHLLSWLVAPAISKNSKSKGRPPESKRDMLFAIDYIKAIKAGASHGDIIETLANSHGIKSMSSQPESTFSYALSRGLQYLLENQVNKLINMAEHESDAVDNPDVSDTEWKDIYEYCKELFREIKEIQRQQEERKRTDYRKNQLN